MKTQKMDCHGLYLQKGNNRWKWMAGATAATAAGVTASQASAITINLVGNYISVGQGNHLNADLTGDGHPDLIIANASFAYVRYTSGAFTFSHVKANLNGVVAHAFFYERTGFARLGSQRDGAFFPTSGVASVMGAIPVFFKDLHINGGTPTRGSLEVTVSDLGPFDLSPTIQLDSLTYNTPGQGSRLKLAVPDQGSSLALLAMGAGGILAMRRWKDAVKFSREK